LLATFSWSARGVTDRPDPRLIAGYLPIRVPSGCCCEPFGAYRARLTLRWSASLRLITAARGTWRHIGSGYGQAEITAAEDGPRLRLTTDLNVGFEGPRAAARRRLRAGERVFCALSWEGGTPPETFDEAHQRLARTTDFWHEWISRGKFPDHPWREYLQRSALTLKGLIYAPTGALLAAATSSLPETPGGERNYDYR
jgi:alpha,alpha-trehalase